MEFRSVVLIRCTNQTIPSGCARLSWYNNNFFPHEREDKINNKRKQSYSRAIYISIRPCFETFQSLQSSAACTNLVIFLMAAMSVPRFLLVLCLFCVLIHAAFSHQGKPNIKESLMQMLGRKLPDLSQNVSIAPPATKTSPDYLIKLLNMKTNATARRGNTVYGFTDNG